MSNFDATQNLTLDHVREISRELPPFSLDGNQRTVDSLNATYLNTYGFSKMSSTSFARYTLGYLQAGGYKIAVHCWLIENPRATVYVCHGLFDHAGLYLDLIDALLNDGYMVVAIDLPGHGLSEGAPGVIANFSEYAHVIDDSLSILCQNISAPIFAIGQSTGCAAILNYVLNLRGQRFEKLVLLAPLVKPNAWPLISMLYTGLHKFIDFVPRQPKENSHCRGFNTFLYNHDPLQPRSISVKWVGAMKAWVKDFSSFASVDIDTLIVQGDADTTVLWRQNLPAIQEKISSCQIQMIEGAMHHLVNEGDAWRDPVFDSALTFLGPVNTH